MDFLMGYVAHHGALCLRVAVAGVLGRLYRRAGGGFFGSTEAQNAGLNAKLLELGLTSRLPALTCMGLLLAVLDGLLVGLPGRIHICILSLVAKCWLILVMDLVGLWTVLVSDIWGTGSEVVASTTIGCAKSRPA